MSVNDGLHGAAGAGPDLGRRRALRLLNAGFGLIWVFNVVYQLRPVYLNDLFLRALAARPGQAAWYAAYTHRVMVWVQALGASRVAMASAAIGALLGLSLLTGRWLRASAWLGVVYTFFLWTTVGHLGGPYTRGATDPGTLIVYSLVFLFILLTLDDGRRGRISAELTEGDRHRRYQAARVLFGLLWAFDAAWKWTPFFLHHPDTYLVQAQAGQPEWIRAYIQFFIDVIHWIGPMVFGVAAALAETVIAVGLLGGWGLRLILPFGLLYSLAIWTTAEGWGGPYGAVTGVGGDVLGTTIIYALLFLYLMVMFRRPPIGPRPN
ncbi:MAG: hypothetical protein ACYC18_08910 [Gammaproteobacteria bacterium]